MRNRVLAGLIALCAALGLTVGAAAQAEASTGYKSTTCYSTAHNTLTVSSWINDTGTKTWHWSASTAGFRYVKTSISSSAFYAASGYYTNASTLNRSWVGNWTADGLSRTCSLVV